MKFLTFVFTIIELFNVDMEGIGKVKNWFGYEHWIVAKSEWNIWKNSKWN